MNRLTEAPGPPDEAGSPGNQLQCEPRPLPRCAKTTGASTPRPHFGVR
jgi:hypothetical protein